MKRVGKPVRQRPRSTAAATTRKALTEKTPEDVNRVVRRRLESYKSLADDVEQSGKPMTKLEVASIKMQAKGELARAAPRLKTHTDWRIAEVTRCLKKYPTKFSLEALQRSRKGHFVQLVPAKRSADETATGGNHLQTYLDCIPMSSTGFTPLGMFATPIKTSSLSAASPVKAVSPILSLKPTLSPAGVMATPNISSPLAAVPESNADTKSPTKKEVRPTSPIERRARRISETVVELLPAATPNKAEPSPTKSASPPSPVAHGRRLSPFVNIVGPLDMAASPFSLPSPSAFSINLPSIRSPAKTKSATVIAATPSRAPIRLPSTPQLFTPATCKTADVASPLGLVALFASPGPEPLVIEGASTPQKTPSFDFGTISPSFNSVSWLNPEPTPEHNLNNKPTKKSTRRQSEPLIRNCLRSSLQRRSMSPQKLVFDGEVTFDQQKPVNEMIPSTATGPEVSDKTEEPAQQSPVHSSPVKKATSHVPKPVSKPRVLSIDMHENPDIFGTKPVPTKPSPVMDKELPRITEDDEASEAGDGTASVDKEKSRSETHLKAPGSSTTLKPESQDKQGETAKGSIHTMVDDLLSSPDTPRVSDKDATCDGLGIVSESKSKSSRWGADLDDNENTPHKQLWRDIEQYPASPVKLTLTMTDETDANATATGLSTPKLEELAAEPDYDSPGRDYMREFIKRSKPKPKRLSATETGSPLTTSTKRQPLADKSPNTSPNKSKRKPEQDDSQGDGDLPKKRAAKEPEAKKARRDKPKQRKVLFGSDKTEADAPVDTKAAIEAVEEADEEEDDAEMDGGVSRRSSRIRNQDKPTEVKSSIPTPIKIGRAGGRGSLNSAARNEQQDVTNQTRMNTRKNKGSAEYPSQMLTRLAEEIAASEAEQEGPLLSSSSSSASPEEAEAEKKAGRSVGWKTPLVSHQEEKEEKTDKDKDKDKAKKARGLPRPTKTYGSSGIAKPTTRAKSTEQKARTARLAEHFGMVGNGTPAKPQRMTRSKAKV